MFKTLATSLLAVSSSVAFAGQAQACGCAPTCAAPAACAVAPAAPQAAAPAPQTAGTRTYQSFSYEPGAVSVPVMSGRAMARPDVRGGRQGEPWRYGDSKASGRYLWNAR